MSDMTKAEAIEWLKRNVTFRPWRHCSSIADKLISEYTECLSILSNDQPCPKCEEWEKAWDGLIQPLRNHFKAGISTHHERKFIANADILDPRRKPKPTPDPHDLWRRVTKGWRL